MKTKHLLTALALPAIFAACTADDIVTEGVNVGQDAQRIALNENFKMNFGGVESRLSAGKPGEAFKFDFEKGDKVGGAIIDQFAPDADAEEYEDQYTIVPFVSANQPFTFDGTSEWAINHTMVEGKYLFYYPYNEANNSRGAAKYSIPVMQDLSDMTTGEFNPKAAIERYSMAVGYQFLSEKDLSASVELAPIFSYARVVMTLDNQYAGGEIDKIVLQATGTEFKLNGQLHNDKIADIFIDKAENKDFDWEEYTTTADFEISGDEDAEDPDFYQFYNEELNKTSEVIVGKVPAGTKMIKDAQNNHSFETYMVVPAQSITGTGAGITVYLYTKEGTIYSGVATYKGALTFNRNTPKKLTVELGVHTTQVPYVIASQEDWNTSVSMMAKDEDANFIIADSEFAINNETKFPKTGSITVDKVTVSGNNVTMKNVVATEVTVAEGAKLNADVTTTIATIINEGEVVVVANPEVESRAVELEEYHITAIENHATLTINKDAVITLDLTNEQGAVVNNAGTLNVEGSNEGTINNTGAINFVDDFTNESREYELVGEEYKVVNEPKIDNAATGEIRATVGDLTNESLIVNAGILSCGNNAGLINNNDDVRGEAAVIDAKANSITLISSSEDGKVIVYALKQANMSINDGKGTVEYTANANINIDESNVTDVIATASITITQGSVAAKNGKLQNLKVAADATITVVAPETNAKSFASIEVAEGKKLTLGSNISTAALTVNEKATVVVPAEKELTVSTSELANDGTIVVTGKMIANSVAKEDGGVVLDNGGTGKIDWANTEDEDTLDEAEEAYQNAMKTAMSTFVSHWGSSLQYDLTNDSIFANNVYGSKNVFETWVNNTQAAASTPQGLTRAAFDSYKSAYATVNGETAAAALNIKDYYDDAVAAYINTLKTTTAYKNWNVEDVKVTVGDLDNFFVEKKIETALTTDGGTLKTVSAKIQALNQFKDYVRSSISINEVKLVLCSATSYDDIETYIPAYEFAFKESHLYGVLNNIYMKANFAGLSTTNVNDALVALIKHVANNQYDTDTDADSKMDAASADYTLFRQYIINNNYEAYLESLQWNYSDETVKGAYAEVKKINKW